MPQTYGYGDLQVAVAGMGVNAQETFGQRTLASSPGEGAAQQRVKSSQSCSMAWSSIAFLREKERVCVGGGQRQER